MKRQGRGEVSPHNPGHQCKEKHQFRAILRPLWRRWQQLCQPARSPNIHSWCWTAGHTKNQKSINFILSKCQRQRDWSGWSSLLTSWVHTAFVCTLEKEKQLWRCRSPWSAFLIFVHSEVPHQPVASWPLQHWPLRGASGPGTAPGSKIHADPNLDALVPCLSLLLHLLWHYNRNVAMLLPIPKSPVNSWVSYDLRFTSVLLLSCCFCLFLPWRWKWVGVSFYRTTLDGARCCTFNEAPCSTIYWIKEMTCGAFNHVESKYATWNCCFPLHACPVTGLTPISDPSSLP